MIDQQQNYSYYSVALINIYDILDQKNTLNQKVRDYFSWCGKIPSCCRYLLFSSLCDIALSQPFAPVWLYCDSFATLPKQHCIFMCFQNIFTSSPTIGIFSDMLSKISFFLSSVKNWHDRAKRCECERNGWTMSVKSQKWHRLLEKKSNHKLWGK